MQTFDSQPRSNSQPVTDHDQVGSKKVEGIVTALVTPLDSNRNLDVDALEQMLERQILAGVHGIFTLGSVGEGPLLDDSNITEVAKKTVSIVGRRCPVFGGASDNSVYRCLRRLDVLAEAGVDIGVLTLPYYGWPHCISESVSFFSSVAKASPLPIMVYDLPKAVGWRMPLELVEALFEIENIVGLKCTHEDVDAMIEVCASTKRPPHFAFLPGNSGLALDMLKAGAQGIVCTPSNIFPEPFVELYRAFKEDRLETIDELIDRVIPPLVSLLAFLPSGASSIKAALEAQGLAKRFTVPPWPQATDEDIQRIREILETVSQTLDEIASS